jgi:hypothetical protein
MTKAVVLQSDSEALTTMDICQWLEIFLLVELREVHAAGAW